MKVAIWGSYNHGNFGDDVMAVLFARAVAEAGGRPVVYRMDRELADRHDVETEDALDPLVDGARLVIMGGGAMLAGGGLRKHAQRWYRDYNRDFARLASAAERAACPIHAISIGGDGGPSRLSKSQRRLYSSEMMRSATVRLPTDVATLEAFGIPTVHHPDILLAGPEHLGVVGRRDPDRVTIGLNIFERTGRDLADGLMEAAAQRPDLRLVFIHSHLPSQPQRYEIQPDSEHADIVLHRDTDPAATCETIASLDVLVTSKLHLGVTALAAGVPFVSFAGPPKARAFLEGLGGGAEVYDQSSWRELLDLLLESQGHQRLTHRVPWPTVDAARQASEGHLDALRAIISAELGRAE
jgi:hypothetical protein